MRDDIATPIAVAVVVQEDAVLIGQRPASVALGGLWEFPGGKIEPNETPEATACRECLEETGLIVEVTCTLGSQVHTYDHGTVHLHFLECRASIASTEPQPPFRWAKLAELNHYEFPSANATIIAQLLQRPC